MELTAWAAMSRGLELEGWVGGHCESSGLEGGTALRKRGSRTDPPGSPLGEGL